MTFSVKHSAQEVYWYYFRFDLLVRFVILFLQTAGIVQYSCCLFHVQHRGRLLSRHESDRCSLAHVYEWRGMYM